MQDKTYSKTEALGEEGYDPLMPRRISKPRSKCGKLLTALRTEAGLSQAELARLVGVPQPSIAYWEHSERPPRADIIPKLAEVLGVTLDVFLNGGAKRAKKGGPVGKAKRAFEEVSKLPRRQQEKIVEIVNALVSQYKRG